MNIPRNEYPRPQLRREGSSWVNLNGQWEFEIDAGQAGWEHEMWDKEKYTSEITVPFVPESSLSGIGNTDFMKVVWYRRIFRTKYSFDRENERLLIHFGAVDYQCDLRLNGVFVGTHIGGYTPFCYDITDIVRDGENTISVCCVDDTRSPRQPSGKQCPAYNNFGCFYTRCTGIWQTVWLEYVPRTYIKKVKMTPDVKNEKLDVTVTLAGDKAPERVAAAVSFGGEKVIDASAAFTGMTAQFSIPVQSPVLWSAGCGNLYDITFTAGEDTVESYFGMRSIEISGCDILLNSERVFQKLILDQGYYPDGIYTARDDDEIKRDIELSMSAGFNGARMHMKVFEPRYIYWADKMGYLLWGEYPNWGLDCSLEDAIQYMLPEWTEELERDYNSPAIIGWCPFNETNGQRRADFIACVYNVTKLYDQSRPVIDTSGYYHVITDVYDVHDYTQEPEEFKKHFDLLVTGEGEIFQNFSNQADYDGVSPYFVSEFGGAFWDIDAAGHGGNDQQSAWGYGQRPADFEEFYERFEGLCRALIDNERVCGFCYTQLYDVMQEKNGLFSFDRRAKFDVSRLKQILAGESVGEPPGEPPVA